MGSVAGSFSESEVRHALSHVLSSSVFGKSERHRRFLAFIVEETLQGRGDRLKAYTIATAAFDRGEGFDPQQDSIVRIEAGRLRRALELYYLTEGAGDHVRIVVAKGSYLPQFIPAQQAAPDPCPRACTGGQRRGPRIFVAPFEQEAGEERFSGFGAAFTRQVIMGLTRFGTLFVYGAATAQSQGTQPDLAQLSRDFDVDFLLTGCVAVNESRLTVETLLQEAPESRYVWTERFERDLEAGQIRALRDEVATTIVRSLAQPYGILQSRVLDHEGEAPERFGSYRAVLDYYQFARGFDMTRLDTVRCGLEKAVEDDPAFAEGLACLSRLYTDQARFGPDALEDLAGRLDRATALARNAISLAPNSSGGYHALALAFWFGGDVDGSLAAFHTALALNPNDTEIMADLGLRLAVLAQWDEAIPLVEESYRRNPCQANSFRMAFALWHYCEGRHEDALREALMVASPDVVYPHLVAAAAAAELGRRQEARASVAEIERVAPGYGLRLVSDLAGRNVHPDVTGPLIASLRKAGLQGIATGGPAREVRRMGVRLAVLSPETG
jgi:TolB-like protein